MCLLCACRMDWRSKSLFRSLIRTVLNHIKGGNDTEFLIMRTCLSHACLPCHITSQDSLDPMPEQNKCKAIRKHFFLPVRFTAAVKRGCNGREFLIVAFMKRTQRIACFVVHQDVGLDPKSVPDKKSNQEEACLKFDGNFIFCAMLSLGNKSLFPVGGIDCQYLSVHKPHTAGPQGGSFREASSAPQSHQSQI